VVELLTSEMIKMQSLLELYN